MKRQVSSLHTFQNTHCKLHKYNRDGESVSHLLALLLFSTVNCMFLFIYMELYMAKRFTALWPLNIFTDLTLTSGTCIAREASYNDPSCSKCTNLTDNE